MEPVVDAAVNKFIGLTTSEKVQFFNGLIATDLGAEGLLGFVEDVKGGVVKTNLNGKGIEVLGLIGQLPLHPGLIVDKV